MIEKLYEGRPYHNWKHIMQIREVLMWFRDIDKELDLAIMYHDAVYIPGDPDNELASAVMACDHHPKHADFLMKAIVATKKHEATGDQKIDMFLDADMSILGMPWERYDAYRKGIREEYAAYSDEEYCLGRIAFLKSFDGFITPQFQNGFGEQARQNIARELKELE